MEQPVFVPKWIAERVALQARRRLEASLQMEQERTASLILANHAAGFWRDFLSALGENVQALKKLKLSGTLTTIRESAQGPQLCRITIERQNPFYRQTYSTIQFSLPAGDAIRSNAVTGEGGIIRLVATPEANCLHADWEEEFSHLTARQAAESLVQEMVERV